jgi:hypothetical protein
MMADYRSDPASSGQLTVTLGSTNIDDSGWSGYEAGKPGVKNSTYVAVKADLTVPKITGTACSTTSSVFTWIGLGGHDGTANDLVQQGLVCGNKPTGAGAAFLPLTNRVLRHGRRNDRRRS